MGFVYNLAAKAIAEGSLDLSACRVMLVTAAYESVADRDDDFVSAVNATRNPGVGATAEINATAGYVRGFGGSGRQMLAGVEITEDDANDRALVRANHHEWTAVTTVEQVAAALLFLPGTSDVDSMLVAKIDGAPLPTTGAGIVAQDVRLVWPDGDATKGNVLALPTT